MNARIFALGGILSLCYLTFGQHLTTNSSPVVANQEAIGDMACGPYAIWHMVANGSKEMRACGDSLPGDTAEKRIRSIIENYCSKPSVIYSDKRNRYTTEHGMAPEDLVDSINDFISSSSAMRVSGNFLDRKEGESGEVHLRRINDSLAQSLKAGVPPIIEIRSFVAQARPDSSDFLWEGLFAHFITVVEIDPIEGENERGFRFRYADSYTGKIETAYAHVEEARNFSATKKLSVSPEGVEKWEWVTDRPYLLITAPTVRLLTQNQPFHARTTIVLRYGVMSSLVPFEK